MATRGYYTYVNAIDKEMVRLYVHWDNYPDGAYAKIHEWFGDENDISMEDLSATSFRDYFIKEFKACVATDIDGTVDEKESNIGVDYHYYIATNETVSGCLNTVVHVYREEGGYDGKPYIQIPLPEEHFSKIHAVKEVVNA